MVLFPGEASPTANLEKALALSGRHLVLEFMWGTDKWGNGATFRRMISMDISSGENAVHQLAYCTGDR